MKLNTIVCHRITKKIPGHLFTGRRRLYLRIKEEEKVRKFIDLTKEREVQIYLHNARYGNPKIWNDLEVKERELEPVNELKKFMERKKEKFGKDIKLEHAYKQFFNPMFGADF
ncbi:MAG: hypothetical protein MHPSP_002922 [Paramarteilia canceri]